MIKKLFEEFVLLNCKSKSNKYNNINFKDEYIDNKVILRKNGDYKLLYLMNGTSITFPLELVNVFTYFFMLNGDRVLKMDENKLTDNTDRFIYYMTELIRSIENHRKDIILNLVVKLCETGTIEFNNWCKESLDETYGNIKLISITRYLDI